MTTRFRETHTVTRLLLAALVGALALLAGTSGAAAAPAATQHATSTCWLQVINDWLDNNQVDGTYPIPCYTQAIQHLNQYPDVQNYSSAMDDIHRALLAAIHQERGNGPGTGGPGNGGPSSPGSGGAGGPGSGSGGPGGGGGSGPVGWISSHLGPGSAQSVPLPLLVLGGLALLLLLAALATWVARRIQARRVTAAPAPATGSRPRR